jgi:hypothetical protein
MTSALSESSPACTFARGGNLEIASPRRSSCLIRAREIQAAARAIGQQIRILSATTEREIDAAFASVTQHGVGALVIGADAFFDSRRDLAVALAAQYAVPTIYSFAAPGGLISYGASIPEGYRQARPNLDRKRIRDPSSRSDHRAGGAPQAARDLL